ncbi:MAG: hypothetical protein R3C26_25285 [Calditrichia bacterium]
MNDKLKIAYIAAGAGGMYCGVALAIIPLARAIRELGHDDRALIPTYTPMRTDGACGKHRPCVLQRHQRVSRSKKLAWARNRSGWLIG